MRTEPTVPAKVLAAVQPREGDDTPIFDDTWAALYLRPDRAAPQPTRRRRVSPEARAAGADGK